MTRQSTPKHEVVHASSGVVALSGVSKTDAIKVARGMCAGRKGSFYVRPVKK